MVREPRPPSPWNQTLQADCGRRRFLISGYGVSVSTGATPRVTFGGHPLAGREVAQLIADLSARRGVYRFSVQCERTGGVTWRIYHGEVQGGTVNYRSALAWIKKDGSLEYYSGLGSADAETFWGW